MAKGKKTGGRPFEKGHHIGRPALPGDLKAARKLTRTEFERIVNQFYGLTATELAERQQMPETTVLEHIVLAVLRKSVEQGDPVRAEWLLSRTIGKVKNEIEVAQVKPVVIDYGDGTETHLTVVESEEK